MRQHLDAIEEPMVTDADVTAANGEAKLSGLACSIALPTYCLFKSP